MSWQLLKVQKINGRGPQRAYLKESCHICLCHLWKGLIVVSEQAGSLTCMVSGKADVCLRTLHRSQVLLFVQAELAMQRGGLLLKHHWEACLMPRLEKRAGDVCKLGAMGTFSLVHSIP